MDIALPLLLPCVLVNRVFPWVSLSTSKEDGPKLIFWILSAFLLGTECVVSNKTLRCVLFAYFAAQPYCRVISKAN